ncbi:MAG: hypothetical protein MHPSP_002018, partial [Paramarteilia canceri]
MNVKVNIHDRSLSKKLEKMRQLEELSIAISKGEFAQSQINENHLKKMERKPINLSYLRLLKSLEIIDLDNSKSFVFMERNLHHSPNSWNEPNFALLKELNLSGMKDNCGTFLKNILSNSPGITKLCIDRFEITNDTDHENLSIVNILARKKLKNLQKLSMAHISLNSEQIKEFTFEKYSHILELNLSNNCINYLPDSFEALQNLIRLNLSHNSLENCYQIYKMKKIEHLYLNNNK